MSAVRISSVTPATDAYAITLASLPVSFTAGTADDADAWFVPGAGNWPERCTQLIDAGARALVISQPAAAEPDAVQTLQDAASENSVVIELAERFAGNPALTEHEGAISEHLDAVSALIVTERTESLHAFDAALSVLRTSRALGRPLHPTSVRTTPTAVFVHGDVGRVSVRATVIRSTVGVQQRIQGIGFGRTLDFTLWGAQYARPADLFVATRRGQTQLPTIWETADRAAWKRLHRSLRAGGAPTSVLDAYADDVRAVHRLL